MKIDIRAVLFNISNLVPEEQYDDDTFLEWAYSALRMINSKNTYEQVVGDFEIKEHIINLPAFKSINQVRIKVPKTYAGYNSLGEIIEYSNDSNYYVQVQETNETFFNPDPCVGSSPCIYKFKVSKNTIYFNVKEGTVQIDYNIYSDQIEDNEFIKKAIEDFILYKLYQRKSLINEKLIPIAREMYNNFLISAAQARGNDNSPKLTELENIRVNYTNMLPNNRAMDFYSANNTKLNHL